VGICPMAFQASCNCGLENSCLNSNQHWIQVNRMVTQLLYACTREGNTEGLSLTEGFGSYASDAYSWINRLSGSSCSLWKERRYFLIRFCRFAANALNIGICIWISTDFVEVTIDGKPLSQLAHLQVLIRLQHIQCVCVVSCCVVFVVRGECGVYVCCN